MSWTLKLRIEIRRSKTESLFAGTYKGVREIYLNGAIGPSEHLLPESRKFTWNWILRVLDIRLDREKIRLDKRVHCFWSTFPK